MSLVDDPRRKLRASDIEILYVSPNIPAANEPLSKKRALLTKTSSSVEKKKQGTEMKKKRGSLSKKKALLTKTSGSVEMKKQGTEMKKKHGFISKKSSTSSLKVKGKKHPAKAVLKKSYKGFPSKKTRISALPKKGKKHPAKAVLKKSQKERKSARLILKKKCALPSTSTNQKEEVKGASKMSLQYLRAKTSLSTPMMNRRGTRSHLRFSSITPSFETFKRKLSSKRASSPLPAEESRRARTMQTPRKPSKEYKDYLEEPASDSSFVSSDENASSYSPLQSAEPLSSESQVIANINNSTESTSSELPQNVKETLSADNYSQPRRARTMQVPRKPFWYNLKYWHALLENMKKGSGDPLPPCYNTMIHFPPGEDLRPMSMEPYEKALKDQEKEGEAGEKGGPKYYAHQVTPYLIRCEKYFSRTEPYLSTSRAGPSSSGAKADLSTSRAGPSSSGVGQLFGNSSSTDASFIGAGPPYCRARSSYNFCSSNYPAITLLPRYAYNRSEEDESK